MQENNSITKDYINSIFSGALRELITENRESIENEDMNTYLNILLSLFNTLSLDLIVTRLSEINFDFDDLYLELDYTSRPENDTEMVSRVIELFIAKEMLKISPFLNKETGLYDVFLSHCSWDAREVLGIKLILEKQYNLKAYVDWLDDKQANFPRSIKKIIDVINEVGDKKSLQRLEKIYEKYMLDNSNKKKVKSEEFISNLLIKNISMSKSVFYIQSRHYDHSRWMPYELGIAEASKKIIYRLPIKYIKTRKKYGKRSGFLVRYQSIVDKENKLKKKALNMILH